MAINRYKLVSRHNPEITRFDPFSPLTVGNGEIAYSADVTGLQTFPEIYEEGIPLCTQSQWGWHTTPAAGEKESYKEHSLQMEMHKTLTRNVGYATEEQGQEVPFHWLRQNPHRLHLGRIGLDIIKEDGSPATPGDIIQPCQRLDMWKGILKSSFFVEGQKVNTIVCCHPKRDILAFQLESELIKNNRMSVKISLPYGSADKSAADWNKDNRHYTNIAQHQSGYAKLTHILDKDSYHIRIAASNGTDFLRTGRNSFSVKATCQTAKLEIVFSFSPHMQSDELPTFDETSRACEEHWEKYWMNGGMIEFQGSTDVRANELERRVVLSQYLMAVQCSGSLPPQETGLTFNSWYGKFHLEMHWWHGVHFPLWGRTELFEKSMWWYHSILPEAKKRALFQGYKGARWPKMVSQEGVDSPSQIGPLLIWQQPHPIYYAELLYRSHPTRSTLENYKDIVFETADFMASYAEYDCEQKRYVLGPSLIPAQENHAPQDTLNPTFELEYWFFGLNIANEWRKRLNLGLEPEWQKVAEGLAPLPVKDGVYLAHENCPDTFEKYNHDHPSMLGALGILPGKKVNSEIMLNTLEAVFQKWNMDEVWGWDFPMMAMTSARLGKPEMAVEALLYPAAKNEYLPNGHNKQADRKDLPVYLPGNGGLLTAIAMMAAGWEGCDDELPGFPKDGSWRVTWEGLHPAL